MNHFNRFLAPPAVGDEEIDRLRQSLHFMLLGLLAAAGLAILISWLTAQPHVAQSVAACSLIALLACWLNWRGAVQPASFLVLATLLGLTGYLMYMGDGLHDVAILICPVLVIAAGLLLRQRAFLSLVGLTIAIFGLITYGELNGVVKNLANRAPNLLYSDFAFAVLIIGVAAVITYLLAGNTRQSLRQARQKEQALAESLRQNEQAVVEQQQISSALRQREAILEAVTFAAEQFLKTPDWRFNIQAVLERLGLQTNASHVYIFENHLSAAGVPVASQRYEWAAPGCPVEIDNQDYQEVPLWAVGFERWHDRLSQDEPFYGSLKTFLPSEAAFLVPRGIKSLLDVPIYVDGLWWGNIGFDDYVGERIWSTAEIEACKAAASIIGAAIQRQRTDRAVQQLNNELERRVQERTRQLETTNHELESFTYSVSHDLRAPLRALAGFSQILIADHASELSGPAQHHLRRISHSAQRMGQLIDGLLAFARLGRQSLRFQTHSTADLRLMIDGVLAELRSESPERAVTVTVGDLASCEADSTLLRQVFVNLLSNAFKYTGTRSQAHIYIGSRSALAETIYLVQDNGVGFDMQYANKLFGVFQRLHTDDFEGTGVGLALVKRIVERHGGRIWAEAALNKGATFYFTLALTPAASPEHS